MENTYYVGQTVSWRDNNDEMHDGWKVNAYNATNLQYELVKDGKRVWVDDCRISD